MKFTPKRSLGQNFLKENHFRSAIADYALSLTRAHQEKLDFQLVEIGPGEGALTHAWRGAVHQLCLVEIDDRIAQHWTERRDEFRHSGTEMTVKHESALTVSGVFGHTCVIVANLPFNIATPIYTKILEEARQGTDLVLMFQKEVAQRMIATEGKTYGSLSVWAQTQGAIRRVMEVPPAAFAPRPNVAAWVVHQTIQRPKDWTHARGVLLEELLKVAFSERRKQLLKRLVKLWPHTEDIWRQWGWSSTVRAEELDTSSWWKLTCQLSNAST